MSIARAFTTRRVKQSVDLGDAAATGAPQRSNTTKAGGVSIRHKISAPVELIHTTNMLSYNAPDLYPRTASSSTSTSSAPSAKSDDDSDTALTSASTPPTSPDSPFRGKRSLSPEPNHLSCYFAGPKQATAALAAAEPPVIPARAPSHTKKSYEGLARQRSASRLSELSNRSASTKAPSTFSRASSGSTSTSTTSHDSMPMPPKPATMTSPPPTPSLPLASHRKEYSGPFGNELAQVSELAEEYSPREKGAVDEEEQELRQKGLLKFSADDYLREIQGLVNSIFADARPVAALWI